MQQEPEPKTRKTEIDLYADTIVRIVTEDYDPVYMSPSVWDSRRKRVRKILEAAVDIPNVVDRGGKLEVIVAAVSARLNGKALQLFDGWQRTIAREIWFTSTHNKEI